MGSRRARRLLAIGAVISILVAAAYGLTYSAIFGAKSIRVVGAATLGDEAVMRLSGVRPGVNVFHLDVQGAERRLETDPRIANAIITVELPSTLVIHIVERRPVAIVAQADGRSELLGPDGLAIGLATGEDLPTLRVKGADVLQPSQMRVGASVAANMPVSLRTKVAAIVLLADGSVVVRLTSGVPVSYGPATELAAKAEALAAVLRWAERDGRSMSSVDVSVPGAPTAISQGLVRQASG